MHEQRKRIDWIDSLPQYITLKKSGMTEGREERKRMQRTYRHRRLMECFFLFGSPIFPRHETIKERDGNDGKGKLVREEKKYG